ncbi:MAG: AAA family ATPase [Dehalococcoidales bacterium]|nr:AAA family ATPase [Dehalococcoidales bacterium]
MNERVLIIVAGPSCTGKTTLAEKIAVKYNLLLLYKDGIKEPLMDSLGVENREESRKIGIATYKVLYTLFESVMRTGNSLVIESNFYAEYDSEKLNSLIREYGYAAVQIQCRTESKVLFERYMKRANSEDRHPGHFDLQYQHVESALMDGRTKPQKIDGQLIDLNTTDFEKIDYAKLFETIENVR